MNRIPDDDNPFLKAYYTKHGRQLSQEIGQAVRSGRIHWRAPLGYRFTYTTKPGVPELDPERAPLIREAFELAATGTYSLRQLLRVMTEKGLRTRVGKPLSVSTLRHILHNPFYAGWIHNSGMLYLGQHESVISKQEFLRLDNSEIARQRHISIQPRASK